MKHFILIILIIVASLGGCAAHSQKKEQMYKQWYQTRALMLCGIAEEQLNVGQLDKARNKAQEALTLDPENKKAKTLLGKILIEDGKYQRAIIRFEELHKQYPRDPQVLYLLAVSQEKAEEYVSALNNFRKVHALQPEDYSAVAAATEVMVAMGNTHQAQDYIEGYIEEADDDAALLELAGRLAMMHEEYEKASEYYQRAADVDFKNPSYRKSLARAQFFSEEYSHAVETLKQLRAMEGYKTERWVYTMLGDCHMAMRNPSLARDAYYSARKMERDNPDTWADVAKAALAMGDTPRTILAAREALRLDSGCLDASILLGYALLSQDRADKAISVLEKATRRHPDSSALRCVLGKAYAESGQQRRARMAFRDALRIEPDSSTAKTLLDEAKRGPLTQ